MMLRRPTLTTTLIIVTNCSEDLSYNGCAWDLSDKGVYMRPFRKKCVGDFSYKLECGRPSGQSRWETFQIT